MWETFSDLKRDIHTLHEILQDDRSSCEDIAMQERQVRARLDGFRAEVEHQTRRQTRKAPAATDRGW
jgi:hypothetical protein